MGIRLIWCRGGLRTVAKIAQLGERMTEDHKVRCSIHLLGAFFFSRIALLPSHRVDDSSEGRIMEEGCRCWALGSEERRKEGQKRN